MVAMIQTKAGPVAKPALSVFATALKQERARWKYSRHEIADQCGVRVSDVEAWEKGEAVPDVQRYKRLVGLMRRLANTPPNYSRGTDRATLEDRAVIDIQREALRIKEPEKAPEPELFGAGLRRIRIENKIGQTELGELLGCGGSAVANWEMDRNPPAADRVPRLYEVLPELKTAIDVGAVKAPEPTKASWSRERSAQFDAARHVEQPALAIVPPEPEPKQMTTPASESVSEPKQMTTPAPIPPPAPPPAMLITKADDPIADAANRYARARRALLLVKRKHDELIAAVHDARLAMEKANAEHEAALAAFDAVAAEPEQ